MIYPVDSVIQPSNNWGQIFISKILTEIGAQPLSRKFTLANRYIQSIGPLQDPVTWYRIKVAGTQVAQWGSLNKGTRTSPALLSFALIVPLCNLRPHCHFFSTITISPQSLPRIFTLSPVPPHYIRVPVVRPSRNLVHTHLFKYRRCSFELLSYIFNQSFFESRCEQTKNLRVAFVFRTIFNEANVNVSFYVSVLWKMCFYF